MRRTSAIVLVALVAILCSTTVAGAFDGERHGFILGIGVGTGLTTYTQTVSYDGFSWTSDRESELPLMTDFKIGYAPNDLVEIYYMNKVSWFGFENALGDDVTITSGLGGLGVTYFFEPAAPCLFLTGGIGFSSWTTPFEEDADTWSGIGLTAGVGYEFAPHWYVAGDVCWGKPSTEESGIDFSTNALSLNLTINVIGY